MMVLTSFASGSPTSGAVSHAPIRYDTNQPAAPTTHTASRESELCSQGFPSGVSSSPVMMRVRASMLLLSARWTAECRR
jgi:hypothetical protein